MLTEYTSLLLCINLERLAKKDKYIEDAVAARLQGMLKKNIVSFLSRLYSTK